jgi:hexosaminidase
VDTTVPLTLGVDETYELQVTATGAELNAATQWAALRGIESFSQLVRWNHTYNPAGDVYFVDELPVVIKDTPRFQWRGMLLDSARHFLHMSALTRMLDAMSYVKMNTLHWHLVDDESWPLVSEKYPLFAEKGAYAPEATYSASDVAYIVQYAYDRGIRVVPEFDMPAHATIWGKAYPNLTISCEGGQTLLNPTGPVYDVFKGLLEEFAPAFRTTDFIHLGGDEVWNMNCWEESEEVQAWMKEKGIADVHGVRNYFETQVQNIAKDAGKSAIVWEEVADGGYDLLPSTVVNVWLSDNETLSAAEAGFRVVHSYGYYLDVQVPPGGTHYFWLDTAINFWLQDPLYNATISPAAAARVIGGEASQWSEQVNSLAIDTRIWPRAAATAERLWSPMDHRNQTTLLERLDHMSCRLQQRGIRASPMRQASMYGYCHLPYDP